MSWNEYRPGFWKKNGKGFLFCMDCYVPYPTGFMVHNKVWKEAEFKTSYDGVICIQCFEERLGRTIKAEDLTEVPLNNCVI